MWAAHSLASARAPNTLLPTLLYSYEDYHLTQDLCHCCKQYIKSWRRTCYSFNSLALLLSFSPFCYAMLPGHSGWAVQMAAASRSCVSEQKAGSQQQPCGEVRHSGKYPKVLKFSALPAAVFSLSDHSITGKEDFSWIWRIVITNWRQKQQA